MRYRLVDVRIWCDQKFISLSPLQPSGQALFLYLLTNPNTTVIPGLYRSGAAAMAEELGWSIEGFMKAFEEILDQGLVKADLKSRLIFIPNAMKYNRPQSPNVVKSWALHFDELPECELRNIAYESLKSFTKTLGEAFAKAFEETISKSYCKTKLNQEQDQKQDQEILSSLQEEEVSLSDSIVEHQKTSQSNCPHEEIIALYHTILPMCPQVRVWNKTRRSYLQQRWRENYKHQDLEWWKNYFLHVKQSAFLIGQTLGRDKLPFIADLEWLVRPNNFAKVIEGKYHYGERS